MHAYRYVYKNCSRCIHTLHNVVHVHSDSLKLGDLAISPSHVRSFLRDQARILLGLLISQITPHHGRGVKVGALFQQPVLPEVAIVIDEDVMIQFGGGFLDQMAGGPEAIHGGVVVDGVSVSPGRSGVDLALIDAKRGVDRTEAVSGRGKEERCDKETNHHLGRVGR